MPAYTYRCEHCEAITEQAHGIGDEPVVVCADCGGLMRRVVSGLPAILTSRHKTPHKKIDQNPQVVEDHHDSGCVLHPQHHHHHATQDR